MAGWEYCWERNGADWNWAPRSRTWFPVEETDGMVGGTAEVASSARALSAAMALASSSSSACASSSQ